MRFLIDKTNVSDILKGFYESLKSANDSKLKYSDYFEFLILPSVISIVLICFNVVINDNNSDIIITVLSILVGLLINTLMIIITFLNTKLIELTKIIFKNVSAQISFSIMLSIFAIIFTLLTTIKYYWIQMLFNFLAFYSIALICICLIVIMNTIYVNIIYQINRKN